MAMLVTVMVLLASFVVLLEWHEARLDRDGDGVIDDDDRSPWRFEDGEMWVTGRVTWNGRSETLDYPIVIRPGGRLTLRDCNITWDVEEMVMTSVPCITVNASGTLMVDRSTLSVQADPRLDGAVVNYASYYYEVPNIWRVVNLRGTAEPVLTFEMKWREGETFLIVAVQSTPTGEVEPVRVVEPGQIEDGEWISVEVPLTDYIGMAPRVMLFVDNDTEFDIVLNDLAVTDGGDPLPWDVFSGEGLMEDGWSMEEFRPFYDLLGYHDLGLRPIIVSEGEVEMTDTDIVSLEGVWRPGSWYRSAARTIQDDMFPTLQAGDKNGNIEVNNGSLTMIRTDVSYVPISAAHSIVDISGSSFKGDHDLVTLVRPRGQIEDSSFELLWPEVNRGASPVDSWELSVEEVMAGMIFPVSDCSFWGQDMGIGLNLNHALVDISDCTFDGLGLAVWNHETPLEGGWPGLEAANDLRPTCERWYLETNEVLLEYAGPGLPAEDRRRGDWNTLDLSHLVEGDTYESYVYLRLPVSLKIFEMERWSLATAPIILADPENGTVLFTDLRFHLWLRWTGGDYVTFDPNLDEQTIIMNVSETPNQIYTYIYVESAPGNSTGTINQTIRVRMDSDEIVFPYVYLYKDGVLEEQIDLSLIPGVDLSRTIRVNHTWAIEPGIVNLTAELWGYVDANLSIERLENMTTLVARANGSNVLEDPLQVLEAERGVLLVDPGVQLAGLSYHLGYEEDWEDNYYGYNCVLSILMGEGASVSIDRLNLTVWNMEFNIMGPGNVTIQNLEGGYLYLNTVNVNLVMEDCSPWGIEGYGYGSNITLTRPRDIYLIYLIQEYAGNIIIEDLVTENLNDLYIDSPANNISITNCSFGSTDEGTVWLGFYPTTIAEVRNCTFENTGLRVLPGNSPNWSISITDCEFSGLKSTLDIVGEYVSSYGYYDRYEYATVGIPQDVDIARNTFQGDGSGIVLDPILRPYLSSDNAFSDGAGLWLHLCPNLNFVNETGEPMDYYALALLEGSGLEPHPSSYWPYRRSLTMAFDITSDPYGATGSLIVPIVIYMTGDWDDPQGPVIAFAEVRVDILDVDLLIEDWPYIDQLLREFLIEQPIENNWWIQGDD
jgi:hypothetical protein